MANKAAGDTAGQDGAIARHKPRPLWQRLLRGLRLCFVIIGVGLAMVVAGIAFQRTQPLTLPQPTGPFAVGRTIEDWKDPTVADRLAPKQGTAREVLAWIWYPAAPNSSSRIADYMPAPLRRTWDPAGPWRFLTHDPSSVHGHSLDAAPLAPSQTAFPVVLLRGGASAGVVNYTTLAEDLASHGYVVVGIDAPYRTSAVVFPDGRVARRLDGNNPEACTVRSKPEPCLEPLIEAWTSDMSFAVDRLAQLNQADPKGRFTGRLDLTRVGAVGHSFGGSQSAQFCLEDKRCVAAVNIDGVTLGSVAKLGMAKPFMFIFSDAIHDTDARAQADNAAIQTMYDRLRPDARFRYAIRGSQHVTFSDDGALLKNGLVRALLRAFGKLHIRGSRQLEVTDYLVRTFFDANLKASGRPSMRVSSRDYPEVEDLN